MLFGTGTQESDIPVARIATLLLGPGTSITHAAVRACAAASTLLQWVGEEGTRAYATSDPLTGDDQRLKEQVAVAMNSKWRARAIRFMFKERFAEDISDGLSEVTVRGMEGTRVKKVYQKLATQHGITWMGRQTGSGAWSSTDPLNQAISIANGHLLQVATVAVLAAGYSPAVGLLHTGFNRAYACDIADLHKFQVSVPLAFERVAGGMKDPRREIRHALRDLVAKQGLLDIMIQNSIQVINAGLGRA